jgi:MoaA/NifB/PqqE/SkfB family radical SAM enzyme
VIDGDFTYCNWACGSLNNLQTKPKEGSITTPEFPKIIKLDMDRSCNLKCPSCRESVIIEKNSNKIDQQIRLYGEIKKWAQDNPALTLTLIPVASGEIFASHSGLSFLNSLLDYPYRNLRIDVTTNGTLINRNQELIKNISHLLGNFRVSIDAATPETYAVVRGGDWDELMLGLNFIKDNLKKSLQFNFCIQKNNWHEIKLFAELAHKFGAKISYQKLLDWGHWDIAWWHDNNVFDRTRNTFDPVIDALLQVQAQYPHKIGMVGGIDKYLK